MLPACMHVARMHAGAVKPPCGLQDIRHGPRCDGTRRFPACQDAAEYFQHLLEIMTRSERAASGRLGASAGDAPTAAPAAAPTAAAFQFAIEDRIVCGESGRVSYRRTPANMLSLGIDLAAATNADELEEHRVGKTLNAGMHWGMPRLTRHTAHLSHASSLERVHWTGSAPRDMHGSARHGP